MSSGAVSSELTADMRAVQNESLLKGTTLSGAASARFSIDGREYLNFFGSQYLALTQVPEIRAAVERAVHEGMPFAQHVPAALEAIDPPFEAVERALARACGTEASVYFASGYLIGAIGLAHLQDSFQAILLDSGAHYSLRDAARLSNLPIFEFEHCDADSLLQSLRQNLGVEQRPIVLTDGAFATTGRVPPLNEYAQHLSNYDGHLFVDESHTFGVVGKQGRGSAEYCGVESVATCGSTLSKALCAQGAFIACPASVAKKMRDSPPVRGACAGSPLSAVAAAASLAYLDHHPEIRVELREMADYFRGGLRAIGLEVIDTPAPIVSFSFGTRDDMLVTQRRLFERGIYVYHSTYLGAGPAGMIRCAVFRDHSRADIDTLLTALAEII